MRLDLKSLGLFCRQLGTMLDAGVPLRRSLGSLHRLARGGLRKLVTEISSDVAEGASFAESLKHRGRAFPPLTLNLVNVGERTGNLEAVLLSLADYYDMLRGIFKRVMSKMALPLLQYIAAIGVLAIAKWLRQSFLPAESREASTGFLDTPLALLLIGWGVLPGAYLAYLFVTRTLGGARTVHEVLLKIPVLHKLMRAFALGRFCWCMSLCVDSGVSIHDSLKLSLSATDNAAFVGRTERITEHLRGGHSLRDSLEAGGLFPVDFLEIVQVAEESGKLTESMRHQADQHFENAKMGANAVGMAASGLVWLCVAAFIIYQIFKFAVVYINALQI